MMDFFFYELTVTLISVTVLCWKPQCNMVFCDLNFVLQNTVLNLHNYLLLCQATGMTFFNWKPLGHHEVTVSEEVSLWISLKNITFTKKEN